jgi:hypothetical protein
MPLDEIHAVLVAPDLHTRNDLLAAHLGRLEAGLAQTQRAIASLRDLLEHPSPTAPVVHRGVPATPAAAIRQHALAVDGPIREYYLVSGHDTPDETAWRTEIGWPIFQTGERT